MDGRLPPPKMDLENMKNIQILIIKTKLKSLNLINNPKIFIESKNSLIEKVWDLPPNKKDTVPDKKKIIITNEIKGIVKNILIEKINIKKTKYKPNEIDSFNNSVKWFKFFDEMN